MSVPQVALDAAAHYLSKGLSKDAAVAIAAVLYAGESKLIPGSQGKQATEKGGVLNPDGAFGVESLNGARQGDLKLYMDEYHAAEVAAAGGSYALLNPQLDFVLTEAAGFTKGSNPKGYPEFWAAVISPASHYTDIIDVMVRRFEKPADPAAEIARATSFATELYAQPIAPVQPPAPVPPVPAVPSPPFAPAQQAEKALLNAIQGLLTQLETLMNSG